MSVRHLAVVAEITGLSPTCKLVLYAIASSCDRDGRARLTYEDLRILTGLSERALRTNIAKLKSLALLDRLDSGALRLSHTRMATPA